MAALWVFARRDGKTAVRALARAPAGAARVTRATRLGGAAATMKNPLAVRAQRERAESAPDAAPAAAKRDGVWPRRAR